MTTPDAPDGAILLTVQQVAALMQVSEDTVYRHIASGALGSLDVSAGKRSVTRVPRVAVEAFVGERMTKRTHSTRPIDELSRPAISVPSTRGSAQRRPRSRNPEPATTPEGHIVGSCYDLIVRDWDQFAAKVANLPDLGGEKAAQSWREAGRAFAQGIKNQDARTPRAAAEAAHRPGGPSLDELEKRIRVDRLTRPDRVHPTDEPQPPG